MKFKKTLIVILKVIYFPIYTAMLVVYYLLRIMLAIVYIFLLEPHMAYDILRYMFNYNKRLRL